MSWCDTHFRSIILAKDSTSRHPMSYWLCPSIYKQWIHVVHNCYKYAHLYYIKPWIAQIVFIYFIISLITWFSHDKFNIILSLSSLDKVLKCISLLILFMKLSLFFFLHSSERLTVLQTTLELVTYRPEVKSLSAWSTRSAGHIW